MRAAGWVVCRALQGLRCDHGLAVVGQRLRQVVEWGHLQPAAAAAAVGGRGAGGGGHGALAEDGGAAEAEVVTEAEWLDLERVSVCVCVWCDVV